MLWQHPFFNSVDLLYTVYVYNIQLPLHADRSREGGVHTAIGDPEVGVPKTFRLVYGYSERFTCSDYRPVVVSVEKGFSLHVFRATYGSANY